ncbi:BlaI/MecI/CopY family transcriptional regulator [Tropicimonas sp. TH_r6]|uniref:BlaI/MecI/CopY family transcriptional regulator n=1 Tax=Tropicimonas sp. TH_r6 TaxID=3082085 RepID=UPI0029552E2F|nr:BlaI/MecI/CopY family transcriptional regulator [Tropicimonas sp. TH_r6]MDV7145436.1 BlaI/MecI/CopY family transcriptional regulator [Tropicimonas sp. TH_r6]
MRKRQASDTLTEVELEFMNVVWDIGGGTVRDIHAALNRETERAYTSVATILKILDQKGFLTSTKVDRSLVYRPAVPKVAYQKQTLKHLSNKLFDDTPSALVARLVDDDTLSDEALEEIRNLVNKRLEDGG